VTSQAQPGQAVPQPAQPGQQTIPLTVTPSVDGRKLPQQTVPAPVIPAPTPVQKQPQK